MTSENRIYNHNHVEPTEEFPLTNNGETEEIKRRTFRDKIINFFSNITIEPSLFLFIVANMIVNITSQNLSLDKACRVNLNFTQEICDALRNQELDSENEFERETQKLAAQALSWKTYLSATLPCITILFVGAFSDKTGHRKFFMIVSVFGMLLLSINNILNVYFFYELSLEVLVLSEGIIEGLFGGWSLCILTAFAYISTITTDEDRTYRMGLMSFSFTLAFPLGTGISGVLLRNLGYFGCYGFTASIHFLNLLYLFFVIKDPKRNEEQKKHDRRGFCHLLRQFFKLSSIKAALSVLFRKAPNNRRVRLFVLLIVVGFLFGPTYGEVSIMYMSTRYRFGWNEVQYSLFQTYNSIVHSIGTVFSVMVLSKYLQWHDSLLGIVSCTSKIVASFVYCFATSAHIFYIGPVVEILGGTSLLAVRSIFSKLVEPDEFGKVNALIGTVENLMPLIYVSMYTNVYTATMQVLPGAVYLLATLLTLPAVIVLSWFLYDHRKHLKKRTSIRDANSFE